MKAPILFHMVSLSKNWETFLISGIDADRVSNRHENQKVYFIRSDSAERNSYGHRCFGIDYWELASTSQYIIAGDFVCEK